MGKTASNLTPRPATDIALMPADNTIAPDAAPYRSHPSLAEAWPKTLRKTLPAPKPRTDIRPISLSTHKWWREGAFPDQSQRASRNSIRPMTSAELSAIRPLSHVSPPTPPFHVSFVQTPPSTLLAEAGS